MKPGEIWSRYRSAIYRNCSVSEGESSEVAYWRNHLFASTLIYLLPFSLIALLPGLYISWTNEFYLVFWLDLAAVAGLVAVALWPGIPVIRRKWIFVSILYAISAGLLYFLGTYGPGMLYLFAVTIFIIFIFERPVAVGAVLLNTLLCIILGIAIHYQWMEGRLTLQYDPGSWIAVSSNLVFLSVLAVVLIPIVFNRIQETLRNRMELTRELQRSTKELRESEKNYHDLFDLSPLPMYLFDLDTLRFLDVNRATIRNYGYSREEFLQMTIFDIRPEEDREVLEQQLIREPVYLETTNVGTFRHRKKNGEVIWVELECNDTVYDGRSARIVLANDITDKKLHKEELERSLREKSTLLAEIHHRVKNNLAVVSAVMQLQADRSELPDVRGSLLDSIHRIKAMASIHEHLYRSESFSQLDFSGSLKSLVEKIIDSASIDYPVKLDFRSSPVLLNINQAIPCSLIASEVVTNSVKYAFSSGKNGMLKVEVIEESEMVRLSIEDDGPGLPGRFGELRGKSLGFQLIELLSKQLKAEFLYEGRGEGTRFELRFEKADVKGASDARFLL